MQGKLGPLLVEYSSDTGTTNLHWNLKPTRNLFLKYAIWIILLAGIPKLCHVLIAQLQHLL